MWCCANPYNVCTSTRPVTVLMAPALGFFPKQPISFP
jgi:hypothetical protein